MKKIICLGILMGIYLGVYAQTDIFAGYNSTHSGRSVTLVVSKTIKNRHEFGGGLRFNINRLQTVCWKSKKMLIVISAEADILNSGMANSLLIK